jgi:hypothetical protein
MFEYAGFQIIAAVAVKLFVFWDVTLFSLMKALGDVCLFSLNCTALYL